ncbi:MAG: hypothetical protein HQM02_11080 [Magnetococcales bacterium]|nr:hypothetical protein [Magnetococcales bacterium]
MDRAVCSNITAMVQSIVAGVAEHDNLVADQCALLMQAAERLVSRLGVEGKRDRNLLVETFHKGERMATLNRNLDVLGRCPPLERHEWLRAVVALDSLTGRIDDAIGEAGLMGVEPDQALQEMALLVHSAAESLQQGFAKLVAHASGVKQEAAAVNGLVEAIEMRYLRSLAVLFSMEKWSRGVTPEEVLRMIKRWMIYRCLFDVKQHLATGVETLLSLAAMRESNRGERQRSRITTRNLLSSGEGQ